MIFKSFEGFEPPKFRGSPNIFGQSTKIFSDLVDLVITGSEELKKM